MKIDIPDELYDVFLQFLNLSQAAFTKEDLAYMSQEENKLFDFIEVLLGDDKVERFETRTELKNAKDAFTKAVTSICQ